MNDLTSLLQRANIKSAVIVDDAYDQIPLARDLLPDDASWSQFFDDLNSADNDQLKQIFPAYDGMRADALRNSDAFVATIWQQRQAIRQELVDPLFQRYDQEKAADLAYLQSLTEILAALNLQCSSAGRNFAAAAAAADLIVIDLYLSSSQDNDAMACSINGLKEVINNRMANPPLVILMSRSPYLEEKRKEFRDGSGLFESTFRIIRKTDLAQDGKLQRLLTRLAAHYHDSIRLATFLHSWQTGLSRACDRTANLIRTLDLADVAQIQQLLLAEEGEPPGSYLVDVFDLVLQHEIEGEDSIINAAMELNGLNSDVYPPPYVAGSPDLQALVCRSLFHNIGRLRLKNPTASPVSFGEILQRKSLAAVAQEPQAVETALVPVENVAPEPAAAPFAYMGNSDVFAVMTPACDLQRLAKRILLLKGTLVPLTQTNWFYKDSKDVIRTAVYQSTSGERFYIKWDPKHIEAVSDDDLKKILDAPNGFHIVGRLREAPALELQQKLLSKWGRVGLLAPMPATFPVKIEAYFPNLQKKLAKIEAKGLTDNAGVCFVGRKNEEEARVLVLCEDACESLCKAVQAITLEQVEAVARPVVEFLQSNEALLILQKGVDFSRVSENKFLEINVTAPGAEGQSPVKRPIGLIRQDGDWVTNIILNGNDLKRAGVILVVSEPV
jgi:hypothetical protein